MYNFEFYILIYHICTVYIKGQSLEPTLPCTPVRQLLPELDDEKWSSREFFPKSVQELSS